MGIPVESQFEQKPLAVRVVAVEDQLSFFLTGLLAEEERSMESPRTVSHTRLR